jgi:hypothetical protein
VDKEFITVEDVGEVALLLAVFKTEASRDNRSS